jgi:anaerobic ribonucleoside-triphosphate reductase activating protein
MWDKHGGRLVSVNDLVSEISKLKDEIEGVTFLGGEPLEQIEPVIKISKEVQKIGLSVIVFTGKEYESIKNENEVKELVKYTDILIDGRYEASKRDFSRAWVGSSNQKFYFFSDKYDESIITKYKNKFEIRFDQNSSVTVNGMGDFEKISKIVS